MSETGPWDDEAFGILREWDPRFVEACTRMATHPWKSGVLPRKLVELISVGLNAACTNLNEDGTRRHIRGALDAGATREEILFVLKCAAMMSVHSCSLGAPILLEEAKSRGAQASPKPKLATPACDRMKAIGQWNVAWDPFFALDPAWTDEFMATAAGIYGSEVLPAKDVELMSIAFDASFTHMYSPGTRRHVHNALEAGASMDEVMAVLTLCVAQGVQAMNLAVPLLERELAGNLS